VFRSNRNAPARILYGVRTCLFFFLAMQIPLLSQVGQPYPGGGYPGQSGGGLPIPRIHRGKKDAPDSKTAPLQRATGTLIQLDGKTITLAADDGRHIEYKRTEKTKFLRGSEEMKPEQFGAGDRVSVEATEDDQGYLYAQNVYFEKSLSTESTQAAPPPQRGERAPGNVAAPGSDRADPGPPTLKHGAPPPTPDAPEETAEPDRVSLTSDAPESTVPRADPVIEKAREALEAFTDKLPNYVCTEFMTRYQSETHPADWRPLDVVSAEVVYLNGKENYRNLAVNGKPFHKGIEELNGSWSTGEFVTSLRALFATASSFKVRGQSSIAGVTARVYNYEVEQQRSSWRVQLPSQSLNPSYKGAIWIDAATGRVLRLEMLARAVPKEFPMDTIESAVDYENVLIGGSRFLLPTHAESLSCQRGTNNCTRNTIDFRNYHKYEADSSITFAEK
jgi:hypothetical protein